MVELSQIENQLWEETRRWVSVLLPLAELKACPRDNARKAAQELGLPEQQIYRLIKRLREADGCWRRLKIDHLERFVPIEIDPAIHVSCLVFRQEQNESAYHVNVRKSKAVVSSRQTIDQ